MMRQIVIVQSEERDALAAAAQVLREHEGEPLRLMFGDGTALSLPTTVTEALSEVVAFLAAGGARIGSFDGYTPDEAARLLGVSRSYVAGLLERGELPYRLDDAQVRIAHAELLAHRTLMRARRSEGVRLIQQLSEEEGAYDRW